MAERKSIPKDIVNMVEKLKRIHFARNIFLVGAGIADGVFLTGSAAMGAVALMHNVAGHAEMAARYMGATQHLLPYAGTAMASTVAGYMIFHFAEKYQQYKIEDRVLYYKWQDTMKPVKKNENSKEITQEKKQEKVSERMTKSADLTAVKNIDRTVVKSAENHHESYKKFSSLLGKGSKTEPVREAERV